MSDAPEQPPLRILTREDILATPDDPAPDPKQAQQVIAKQWIEGIQSKILTVPDETVSFLTGLWRQAEELA